MKDISLSKTNAKGEFLYNKIQHISFDEVFSEYMFYPAVCKMLEIFISSFMNSILTRILIFY